VREDNLDVWTSAHCSSHDEIDRCSCCGEWVVNDWLWDAISNKFWLDIEDSRVQKDECLVSLQLLPDREEFAASEQFFAIGCVDCDTAAELLFFEEEVDFCEGAVDVLPVWEDAEETDARLVASVC